MSKVFEADTTTAPYTGLTDSQVHIEEAALLEELRRTHEDVPPPGSVWFQSRVRKNSNLSLSFEFF